MAAGIRIDRTPLSPGLERLAGQRKQATLERFKTAVIRFRPYADLPQNETDMMMVETCNAIIDGRAPHGTAWEPIHGSLMTACGPAEAMGRAGMTAAVTSRILEPVPGPGDTLPDLDTMSAFLEHLDPAALDSDPVWCDGADPEGDGRETPRGAILLNLTSLSRLWSAGLDDFDLAMAYDINLHGLPLMRSAMKVKDLTGVAYKDDIEAIVRLDTAIFTARGDVMPIEDDRRTEEAATSWAPMTLKSLLDVGYMDGLRVSRAFKGIAESALRHLNGTGHGAARGAAWGRAADILARAGGGTAARMSAWSLDPMPPSDMLLIGTTLVIAIDMLDGDPDTVDAVMSMIRTLRLLSGMLGGTSYGGSTPFGRLLCCGTEGVSVITGAIDMLDDGLPPGFVVESVLADARRAEPVPAWDWD